MIKTKALVVCPGRGTYNKTELGYLQRYHSDKTQLMTQIDDYRKQCGQVGISQLDSAGKYSMSNHTRGDNASALVYSCAWADFLSINREKFDLVAVTGNSLGWYVALGCAGALAPNNALKVINTMGTLMHENLSGGQVIYPLLDNDWREIPGRKEMLMNTLADVNEVAECKMYISINLGGFLVFAGNEAGVKALLQRLPAIEDRYPMRLFNHSAFHTPLLQEIAGMGSQALASDLFLQSEIPMIDGRGHIWHQHSTDTEQLWDYTLGEQVVNTYDFSKAIQVAVREFSPEQLIVLGPGATLGGAIAQSLIAINWQGLSCKQDFIERQQSDNPVIISMGMPEQRSLAI